MASQLTTKEWISRATAIHGDKFVYSHVNYVNAKTPVTLVCKIHGPWNTSPDNHITKKRGCPACGGSKKKTVDDFVLDAQNIHGERYDYSLSSYKNSHTALKIICRSHGEFLQSPTSHLSGRGCPKCALEQRVSKDRIESLFSIKKRLSGKSHGDILIVEDTFQNVNEEANFLCKRHGIFTRLVSAVLYGKNTCPQCSHDSGHSQPLDQQRAEEKVRSVLRDGFELKPFQFTGSKSTSLSLICPEHGSWSVLWAGFFRSTGKCPRCTYEAATPKRMQSNKLVLEASRGKRWSSYLKRFIEMHGDKYDYAKSTFVDAKTPITIICPIHGEIQQTPDTHLQAGCRKCADDDLAGLYSERYFQKKPEMSKVPATLYLLHLSWGDVSCYKVGITKTTLKRRFGAAIGKKVSIEVLATMDAPLIEVWRSEVTLLEITKEAKLEYPDKKFLRDARLSPSELIATLPLNWQFLVDWTSVTQYRL